MFLEKFFVEKRYWWIRHTLFWLLVYADGIFDSIFYFESMEEIWSQLYSLVWDMLLVYISIYYLIPTFLAKKRYSTFIAVTIISILTVIIANYLYVLITIPEEEKLDLDIPATLISITFYTVGTLGVAAAIKITKLFYERQHTLNQLKESQLTSEVNYLKQQTNPHFLFNTLNSIYVLSKQKNEKTPNAIMLLSDLMRYQTYDASNEQVPMTKEVDFIKNYLDLEKLRRDKLNVDLNIIGDIRGEVIEPLLFLPFIENAVKHSSTTEDKEELITIKLENTQDHLELQVINSTGPNTLNKLEKENSGFGLENINKRLKLLYPEKHELKVIEKDETYHVRLKLVK